MRTKRNARVERDHEARLHAVQSILSASNPVAERRRVARTRGMSVRSVRRWEQRHREGRLCATPPGPAAAVLEREIRQGLIATLVALGPLAGVNAVRALYGGIPYRMISCMKQRLARVLRRRRGRHERRLTWFEPGAVWAMDFTQPKAKLPGKNKFLLMVRDLASGARLACVPCKGERAKAVVATLRSLFSIHGAPLVIKCDNGPGFRAHVTQTLFDEHDVHMLASPAYRPQYNGSMERSLGWAKARLEHMAERQGHPGIWTDENLEQARAQANATLRPWGANGPSPDEAFADRRPITPAKREAFKLITDERIQELLKTQQDELGRIITDMPYEVMERRSIAYALCKLGYLKIRRGRLSTPF